MAASLIPHRITRFLPASPAPFTQMLLDENCLTEIFKNCYYAFTVILCLSITSFKLLKSCELAVINPFHGFRQPEVKSDASRGFHVRCLFASSCTCLLGPHSSVAQLMPLRLQTA